MAEFWINTKATESPIRAWDQLILGGVLFPGLCQVSCGVGVEIEPAKFPVTPPSGSNPGKFAINLADKGFNPSNVRAVVAVWTQAQWEELQIVLPNFTPRHETTTGAGKNSRAAFDIDHPATTLLGISSVIVKGVDVQPIQEQTLYVVLDLLQYFPRVGERLNYNNSEPPLRPGDAKVPVAAP